MKLNLASHELFLLVNAAFKFDIQKQFIYQNKKLAKPVPSLELWNIWNLSLFDLRLGRRTRVISRSITICYLNNLLNITNISIPCTWFDKNFLKKSLGNRPSNVQPRCVFTFFDSFFCRKAKHWACLVSEFYENICTSALRLHLSAVVVHNSRWRTKLSKSELGKLWRRNYGSMWFVHPEINDFW